MIPENKHGNIECFAEETEQFHIALDRHSPEIKNLVRVIKYNGKIISSLILPKKANVS